MRRYKTSFLSFLLVSLLISGCASTSDEVALSESEVSSNQESDTNEQSFTDKQPTKAEDESTSENDAPTDSEGDQIEQEAVTGVTVSGFPNQHAEAVRGMYSDISKSILLISDGFGHGTGWVLNSEHVLTNWHVVDPMPNPVSMRTLDGQELAGEVIATEEFDDIALIKLSEPTEIPALTISEIKPEAEDAVFFVGHPGSIGDWIMGVGKVSDHEDFFPGFVATTLPADPGASGSPMFNLEGEVVSLISGCMSFDEDEQEAISGDSETLYSSVPGPEVKGNCGGTEITRVMEFIDPFLD
jgi:serine protease Do